MQRELDISKILVCDLAIYVSGSLTFKQTMHYNKIEYF